MHNSRFLILSATLFSLLAVPAFAQAQPAPTPAPAPAAAAAGPVTRDQIPGLVREAIMNDPEIIKDAIQKLREKAEADAKKQAMEGLTRNKDALYNDASAPVAGSSNPDVTIIEFFDYNCGHCRNVFATVNSLIEQDPKVRVIFKEFPIFGGDSDSAARAGLAVHSMSKDKYFKFHAGLMTYKGTINSKAVNEVAKKLGINTDKLKAEMAKEEITKILENNHMVGQDIGIRGTPAFIVGDELIPGEIPLEALKEKIAKLRGGPAAAAPAAAVPAMMAPPGGPAPAPAAPPAPAAAR